MEKMIDANFEETIEHYFSLERTALGSVRIREVSGLARRIDEIRIGKGTVFVVGNGGSAATASHFATDLGVGSLIRGKPVRAVSLCDNLAAITAMGNDLDYDSIFEKQLVLLAKPDDLLILLSASGNSKNLLKAVKVARKIGVSCYSLTGFDGGKLKELTSGANIHIETPSGAYGVVEDIHLAICHAITDCIRL
jgi:D-sedoheptulose 7-phosphate isomerase